MGIDLWKLYNVYLHIMIYKITLSWSVLGKIIRTKISTVSILLSMLGYILIFDRSFAELICSIHIFYNCPATLLSWKIQTLYVGMIFISLSYLFYILNCPELISKHKESENFIEFFVANATGDDLKNMYFSRIGSFGSAFGEECRLVLARNQQENKLNSIDWDAPSSYFKKSRVSLLSIIYQFSDESKKSTRLICSVFLYIGILSILTPGVHTIAMALWSIFI